MIKNNRGITILALTITIIVIIILSSIGTEIGIDMIEKAKYYKEISELKAMQVKVNELYDKYKNDNIEYGETFPDESIAQKAEIAYNHVNLSNLWESDIGNFEDYKYFSKSYIRNELGMEGIDVNFIININTRMVILIDGVKREGITYFALCEIKNEMYNVEYNETN